MSQTPGENLTESVEKMLGRMEKVYQQQALEASRAENVLALLDRLDAVLARMEGEKVQDAEISSKIETLNRSLERALDLRPGPAAAQAVPDGTLDRVIGGVKLFGLILTTLADSIQVTVEKMSQVLNGAGPDVKGSNQVLAARTQADLASILQPVSSLVKNLVEEKMRQQQEQPPPADSAGEEAPAGEPGR